jgi:hypothetical protein
MELATRDYLNLGMRLFGSRVQMLEASIDEGLLKVRFWSCSAE